MSEQIEKSPLEELVELYEVLDVKHQIFVSKYASNGLNRPRAYREAYPDNKEPRKGAWTLIATNDDVARAIELVHRIAVMPKAELVARLTAFGRADWTPFFNEEGKLDLSTDEAKAAMHTISEVHVVEGKDSTTTRLKLEDRQAALDKVARLGGYYDDKMTLTHEWSKEKAIEAIKQMLGTIE